VSATTSSLRSPSDELASTTEGGGALISLAESLAESFEICAADHDRVGEFVGPHIAKLKWSGFLYAPAPAAAGGAGVDSVHDVLVASSRIARADASVVVGANMHLVAMLSYARQWRMALARGDDRRAGAVIETLHSLIGDGAIIGAAVSEPDQDLTRQSTTARRVDGRWLVNGRKVISSLAPAATHFSVSINYTAEDGGDRYAFVVLPRDTHGVTVHDDWDALGLRGSGSVTVTFEDVVLEGRGPGRGAPAGRLSPEWLEQLLTSGPAHASISLGVLEAAVRLGAESAGRKAQTSGRVRPTVQLLAAENAIDQSASRAIFGASLRAVDTYFEAHPTAFGSLAEAAEIFSIVQRAKAFLNQAAPRVVDRAMTMTGGASYMNRHPLSRLYRDARAGAFMHPLGANVAYEYIGAVALGLDLETL
jgi:alkylation response protein AidB-like acyl-CoA dehydrogenase